MHPKEADAMANSVDPNQTASSEAVWSWSALFAETYLSQYIEFLRYSEWWASEVWRHCRIERKNFFEERGFDQLKSLIKYDE